MTLTADAAQVLVGLSAVKDELASLEVRRGELLARGHAAGLSLRVMGAACGLSHVAIARRLRVGGPAEQPPDRPAKEPAASKRPARPNPTVGLPAVGPAAGPGRCQHPASSLRKLPYGTFCEECGERAR